MTEASISQQEPLLGEPTKLYHIVWNTPHSLPSEKQVLVHMVKLSYGPLFLAHSFIHLIPALIRYITYTQYVDSHYV